MTSEFIPVNEPNVSREDVIAVTKAMHAGWISSEGPEIKKFETKLASYHDRKYAVVVSSGTAALEICGRILNFSVGDEVVLPDHTIISCLHPIINNGAVPVFIDSCIKSWNIDVSLIKKKITKRTKAIIAPHLYGLPCEIEQIEKICIENKIKLIEDCAELTGGSFNNRKCGSFGDVSTLSFYANKQITTGEGGAILTNNKGYYLKAKYFRNLCFQDKRRFLHEHVGFNYRMSNIQAALGLSQLKRIEKSLEKRKKIAEIYLNELSRLDFISFQPKKTSYAENVFWVFGCLLRNSVKASDVISKLKNVGVGSRPFFYSLSKQPVVKSTYKTDFGDFKNSETLSEQGFYLPSGLGTSISAIKRAASKSRLVLESLDRKL